MIHLIIMFAKYQIYLNILPTFPEIFIGIKQLLPQLQPQRQLKVKFKFYTLCCVALWSNSIDKRFVLVSGIGFK